MRKKIFHATDDRGRLRCDNLECGYVLPKAQPWGESLIGFSCPCCGDDMLTREDFERSEKFARRIAWINRWFGWLGTKEPPANGHTISVRHNPSGVEIKTSRARAQTGERE